MRHYILAGFVSFCVVLSGCIFERTGYLSSTGSKGYCHTVTPAGFDGKVRSFDIDSNGWVAPSFDALNRAGGYSVRCCKIHPEPLTEGFAVRTGEW